MLSLIYVLLGLFVASAICFSLVCFVGRNIGPDGKPVSIPLSFGLFAWRSIEETLRPNFWKRGKALMLVREGSFVVLVVVAVTEYFLR
jgi:hypothetical protein